MAAQKKKAAKSAKPKTKKKTAKKAQANKKRSTKTSSPPRPPWFSLGLAVLCVLVWGYTSFDVAITATWRPVKAKALSHGAITTSGHDPGDEQTWGQVRQNASPHTVVSYEYDGIAYEQRVPGTLELGSTTEGVVDPDNPGRWRWSGNTTRWWIIAIAGLSALFLFRRTGRRWPRDNA